MFLTTLIIALVTIKKGLKHVGLHLSTGEAWVWSAIVSALVMIGGYIYIQMKFSKSTNTEEHGFAGVEKIFSILMVITACAMAFAHGSNDVANAIGPLSAVASTVAHMGEITAKSEIAWWILPLGGFGIVVGLATMGHKVMATVGTGITELTPSRGFAAQLATGFYGCSRIGNRLTDFNHTNSGGCCTGGRFCPRYRGTEYGCSQKYRGLVDCYFACRSTTGGGLL